MTTVSVTMIWLWKRLFDDPERIAIEERAEVQARAPSPDRDAAPPVRECRVCRHSGPEHYCPSCLAGTMVLRRRR